MESRRCSCKLTRVPTRFKAPEDEPEGLAVGGERANCRRLPLPAAACRCLPLPAAAFRCLSPPFAAFHRLSLLFTAFRCLSPPFAAFRCLSLPLLVCVRALPLSASTRLRPPGRGCGGRARARAVRVGRLEHPAAGGGGRRPLGHRQAAHLGRGHPTSGGDGHRGPPPAL